MVKYLSIKYKLMHSKSLYFYTCFLSFLCFFETLALHDNLCVLCQLFCLNKLKVCSFSHFCFFTVKRISYENIYTFNFDNSNFNLFSKVQLVTRQAYLKN